MGKTVPSLPTSEGCFEHDKGQTHTGTLGEAWSPAPLKARAEHQTNNRKLQHLEAFLAAAGGLCQIFPSALPGATPELTGAPLAQEQAGLREGALPASTCPKQDALSTHTGFLGIPLPVLHL